MLQLVMLGVLVGDTCMVRGSGIAMARYIQFSALVSQSIAFSGASYTLGTQCDLRKRHRKVLVEYLSYFGIKQDQPSVDPGTNKYGS